MVYLIEKGRIPANALDDVLAAIADPKAVLQQVPLDDSIVLKMRDVSRRISPTFRTASSPLPPNFTLCPF